MKFSEVSSLADGELNVMKRSLQNVLFRSRLRSKMPEKKDFDLRSQRRDLARILTVLNSRAKERLNGSEGIKCQD